MPKKVHDIYNAIKKKNPYMNDQTIWAIAYATYNKKYKKKKKKKK